MIGYWTRADVWRSLLDHYRRQARARAAAKGGHDA